ncbi:MAG: hypothetical protein ACK5ZM_00380, partial [bacterium]
ARGQKKDQGEQGKAHRGHELIVGSDIQDGKAMRRTGEKRFVARLSAPRCHESPPRIPPAADPSSVFW